MEFAEKGGAVFVSDIHLGAFSEAKNREIERDFIKLVQHCRKQGMKLFILGDLFDYWMEYKGRHPEYGESVLTEIEKLAAEQPVVYITGNHDNWTGPRIEATGVELLHEYKITRQFDKNLLLLHGDGLRDPAMKFPRPRFHRLLRNPYFLAVYQTIFPPRSGIELMRRFSRFSKLRSSDESQNTETDRVDSWALDQLNIADVDVVICGHHHRPVHKESNRGLYINLGNFFDDRTLAIHTKGFLKLVTYRPDQNAPFEPFGESIAD